jgi:pimeloyl-ACP methyl ester carboxylesterase
MKEIYLIPGLGADHRVFEFLDLSSYTCHTISWIKPSKNESIESYADRLSVQIKSPNPILIGVSFGGMMAIEIAKQIPTENVILISSARTRNEVPVYLRWIGKMGFHKLVPKSWLKKPGKLLFYFFGVKESNEKELLSEIVRDTNSDFLAWAINSIVCWKNDFIPNTTALIHGSGDRLFPFTKGDITVNQGGHFMIVNKAQEISEHVKRILK